MRGDIGEVVIQLRGGAFGPCCSNAMLYDDVGPTNNLDKQQAISQALLSSHTMALSLSIEAFVCSL